MNWILMRSQIQFENSALSSHSPTRCFSRQGSFSMEIILMETILCAARPRDLDQGASFQGLGLETYRCNDRDRPAIEIALREEQQKKRVGERGGDRSEEAEREREIEKMTPTRGNEEIEGRSYKDYAYSPVPVSSPSTVNDTPPVRESVELDIRRTSLRTNGHSGPEDMTEKGSKRIQIVAAATGKSSSINKRLNTKEREKLN